MGWVGLWGVSRWGYGGGWDWLWGVGVVCKVRCGMNVE